MAISKKQILEQDLFKTSSPDMMKTTRLLIIDHDVTRYHSFDLLRYQLFRDTQTRNIKHFTSILPEYQLLLDGRVDVAHQVHFMQNHFRFFNIYDGFSNNLGVDNFEYYERRLGRMLLHPKSIATPTDVSRRFDVVFVKPNIIGYLLQYKGDRNKPSFYNDLTVYEAESLLDLVTAIAIIIKHDINAIMMSSAELAIRLATKLISEKYTTPITFMIARYAYNYKCDGIKPLYPLCGKMMALLELKYKHEFGTFDPFSGLTYRYHYDKAMLEDLHNESNSK